MEVDINGKPTQYKKLQKALYVYIRAVPLFYENISIELKAMGFVINLYDPYVENKTVNGKQYTVVWHVENLKSLHDNDMDVTKITKELEYMYG